MHVMFSHSKNSMLSISHGVEVFKTGVGWYSAKRHNKFDGIIHIKYPRAKNHSNNKTIKKTLSNYLHFYWFLFISIKSIEFIYFRFRHTIINCFSCCKRNNSNNMFENEKKNGLFNLGLHKSMETNWKSWKQHNKQKYNGILLTCNLLAFSTQSAIS